MDIIGRINQRIGFTRTESRIVLFLVGMFMAGGIIRLVRGTEAVPAFDYSTQDSQFAAGAARLNGLTAAEDSSELEDGTKRSDTSGSGRTVKPLSGSSRSKKPPAAASVNINTAGKTELMTLPGIGPSLAERIIAYRKEHGGFGTIEELRKVKGIGAKKFEAIVSFLTTGK